ncbi:MAG TPA: serine/threonine protein kinase [Burkholderiaceae bacterium]|nr:serine/threonine protein kinase [Burkholderiaceae bacterium]
MDDERRLRPYHDLTPDRLLDALAAVGYAGDGRILALNSYENRVYQVWLDDGDCVVAKFYRPGRWSDSQILEEHAFAAELAAAEVPVVAPLSRDGVTLHHAADHRFAVYPRRGGRTPELEDRDVLLRIGRFIGRIHTVGARQPFAQRPPLDVERLGSEPRDYLLQHDWIPAELQPAWREIAERAIARTRAAFEELGGQIDAIRLHGDVHAGNVLWTDAGPHFVDLDDACNGPPVQDLWMLLSGDRDDANRQLARLLRGYEEFRELDRRELRLIEPLRTLRLLHYSAWIARRWDDPAFPVAFPWFGTQRYWQDRIIELREQVALLDEPPLAPDALRDD